MLSSRALDSCFPIRTGSCVGRGLKRKCQSHGSVLTRVAGDVRPRPRAGSRRPQASYASEGGNQRRGRGPLPTGGVACRPPRGGRAVGVASAAVFWEATTTSLKPAPGGEASLSPERGWAGPGYARASVSTPGTGLASLGLPLELQLLPPSLLRFVHSGSKC